jgi:hypothetical protein
MRKSELNEAQAKSRALLVKTLSANGWKGSLFNEQFDQGLWSEPEASMSFANGPLTMRVDLKLEDPRVILNIDSAEGKGLGLVFKCVDNLKPLLDALVGMQTTISADNIKQKSEELLAACPKMFKISASGDKLIPVKANQKK